MASRGYTQEQTKELFDKLHELKVTHPSVCEKLVSLAERLKVPRAKIFANEGLGRRLTFIDRAVLNIYRIYPPNRTTFLSKDECTDIAINFHAFAINLYAMFDNIAWITVLEAGQKPKSVEIGPYKAQSQLHFPDRLLQYFKKSSVKSWFDQYGKLYRDSTAHRIAPYLPSRTYTQEEGKRFQALDKKSEHLLLSYSADEDCHDKDMRLAKYKEIENGKNALGTNSLLIALSLSGDDAAPPVYLHPQLLCDWGLAHELVLEFIESMKEHYHC